MNVLVAWSGGKDSAWMLHRLRARADVHLAGLFTTVDAGTGSIAVHEVPAGLLERQARAAGLPVHRLAIPRQCPNPVYERTLGDFVGRARRQGVTHLAFGDLFLEDIRRYRERQFEKSGVELLFPLWGADTRALAREMTAGGLRAWISCVDTTQAPAEWAGRIFDAGFVEEVRPPVDPCGENGEFHTFVFEGPMLSGGLETRVARLERSERWAYARLEAQVRL